MKRLADKFLGKKWLVVTGHPDDESYTAAGSMHENIRRGGRVCIVCGTFGEKGTSHLKYKVTERRLKVIRKKELKAAAQALGIEKVIVCDFPDGQLANHIDPLYGKVLKIAKPFKPDWIVSFGPDGISGHRDHIAAGSAARQVARKLGLPLAAFAVPPAVAQSGKNWLKSRRKSPHYAKRVAFQKPNLKLTIKPSIKKKALLCHQSQLNGRNAFAGFPLFAVKALMKNEYFFIQIDD